MKNYENGTSDFLTASGDISGTTNICQMVSSNTEHLQI